MAIPVPSSYQQILGSQLGVVRARLGLRKFKPGGQLLTIFEAAAQSDARISADIFKTLLSQDLDSSEGLALDRIGNDEKVPRRSKKSARGEVTISDTAFLKIASTVYHGKAAPIVGSVSVYVSKGSSFDLAPSTGQVYLGRGTPNYEGPLTYSSKTDLGSYWGLATQSTTKFHNQGESVILAQGGNRPIQVGQIVSTAQGAATAPVTFSVTEASAIPDGETEVTLVQIVCSVDGIAGNLPPNSIVSFGNANPFDTAQITNPTKISFGRDVEQDNDYRDRIRQARANKQRGIASAIKNSVIDVTASDEASSILSANVVSRKGKPTVLYIDDGNGYEEKSDGVGYEPIVDVATGGETDFLTISSPISQAFVEASNQAPWAMPDGTRLTIKVGGVASTHYFDSSSFTSPLSASSFDVVSSINSNNNLLFQARLSQNTGSVAFYSKSENNDDLEVVFGTNAESDAAIILGLSNTPTYTTSLYKNDVLLSKDGELAQVASNSFSTWNSLAVSETLEINTDFTGSIVVTITDTDFQALGFPLLGNATPQVWAQALSLKVPGITATGVNDKVVLTSNKGKSSLASVAITGGSLVSKGVFLVSSSQGVNNDYSLDRSVGAIAINTPLVEKDRLTLGTQWAEAFIETDFGSSTSYLSTDAAYYLTVDDPDSVVIPTSRFLNGSYTAQLKKCSPLFNSFDICDGTAPGPILPVIPVTGLKEGDWVMFNDPAFNSVPSWKGTYRNTGDGSVRVIKDADTATRIGHTSTALSGVADLFVLVCGGLTSIQNGIGLPGAIKGRGVTGNSCLYDAGTGNWIQLPNLITPRAYHTATLLASGQVFITGGFDASGNPLASTEIFDPTTRTFTAGLHLPTSESDSTPLPRAHHTATLMTNNMVLIAGGCSVTTMGAAALNSTIRYEPVANVYSHSDTMTVARYGHQAVVDLTTGFVIAIGGISTIASPATPITSVESYNDSAHNWTVRTSMGVGRAFFGAASVTTSGNSKIVVAGNTVHPYLTNETLPFGISSNTFQSYTQATATWGTVKNINANFSTIPVQIAQTDLVKNGHSGTVFLGGIMQTLATYNVTTDAWDSYSADPGISEYIASREGLTGAAPISGGPKGNNCLWFGGAIPNGISTRSFQGIANVDFLDTVSNLRNRLQFGFSALSLTEGRVIATRSKTPPETIVVPANGGTNYTAQSFAPALNLVASDEVAKVLQTTKVRLSTLTSPDGSISIIDKDHSLPIFSPQRTVVSQRSQFATAVSNSEIDVPSGFQLRTVSSKQTNLTGLPQSIILPDYSEFLGTQHAPESLTPNGHVVGLKNIPYGGAPADSETQGTGFGDAKGIKAAIGTFSSPGIITEASTSTRASLGSYIGLRTSIPVTVGNPVYVAEPFKFTSADSINITIDGDVSTKRFTIPMSRKMATNGSYQSPLSLKDADNSNHTISTAFGIGYSFDDFAILSKARVISNSSDVSKRAIWRYYRYGEEGNNATVRYVYPTGPSQPVSVICSAVQNLSDSSYYKGIQKLGIDINVGSGVLRKNRHLSLDTRLGIAKVSSGSSPNLWSVYLIAGYTVTSGVRGTLNGDTTLTISGPPVGIGITSGAVLWYEGTSPTSSTLQSGQFTIKTISPGAPGVWTITIDSLSLNDGTVWAAATNPGTISVDPNQRARFDDEVVVGDFVSLIDPTGTLTSDTAKISSIETNRQWVLCAATNFNPTAVSTVLYKNLVKITDLQIFAPSTNTVAAIVAAVNANPNSPIQGTVTGTGAGVIADADWYTYTQADFRYELTDGVNFVSNTNKPANTGLQTTFDLKLPVNSALAANNDFTNETFYIVPQLAKSVVQWFNTPAITGLWSVATVTTCSAGNKVQIKSNTPGISGSVLVEGGTANLATAAVVGTAKSSFFNSALIKGMVVTTTKAEADGFCGNSWVELDNVEPMTKLSDTSFNWSGNSIAYIAPNGAVTFSSSPYLFSDLGSGSRVFFTVEKVGEYTTINFTKTLGATFPIVTNSGDWIQITDAGNVSPTNQGIFRILRFSQTESAYSYWIDNPNAIEELGSQSNVYIISSNSPIPGDILSINSDAFGEANRGAWPILSIDMTGNTITLAITSRSPNLFVGSIPTLVKDVSVIDKEPKKAIKKVLCVAPNQSNPGYADILLDDSSLLENWSQDAGTVISSLSKLGFPNTIQTGTDAYRYNTGLIAEAKRVIYGDSADVDNYPGYVANGAQVLIQGPTIKQIKVTLQVRLQSNDLNSADTVGAIKSAVGGVINGSAVGVPIAISDIITAAQGISGVMAVSVISPAYDSVRDQIPVRGQEKAMVVNFDTDIQVLVAGI
jgi:hypothetical protein